MITFPNCKINLGLHILQKRSDGFHDLETVFYPVGLQDALEVIHNTDSPDNNFQITGLSIEGNIEDNICFKAYNLLKSDFPYLPSIKLHLHKMIPMGAGLGGGSADGAFTLLLLAKKFGLGLMEKQLISYALQLGSDCPFFIKNTPCIASGRGEIMEEIALDLSSYKVVIIYPNIHINTGWAFSKITPERRVYSIQEIVLTPMSEWKAKLTNDFEDPVFKAFPEIKNIKKQLYKCGAEYASMSGSGSTVYGIFKKESDPLLEFPNHYFIKSLDL